MRFFYFNATFVGLLKHRMKNYLKLMRVEQWVKNLFVFAPLFFSGNIMNAHLFYESLFAFVVFLNFADSQNKSKSFTLLFFVDVFVQRYKPLF